MILTNDTHGIVTSWNSGAKQIIGYAADELLGKNVALLSTPEDRQQSAPETETETETEVARITGRAAIIDGICARAARGSGPTA